MNPIKFKEQNKVLTAPKGMTEEQCKSLPVYTDGKECISCWKMNWKERLIALFYGKIWIFVLSGTETQPPISVSCAKTIFTKTKQNDESKN